MKIVFAGGKQHGYECLEQLIKMGEDILLVFGLKEVGHELVTYDSTEKLTKKHGIARIVSNNLNSPKNKERIKALSPDILFMVKWRTKIDRELLRIPKKGCIVIHDSLLPRYRSCSPLNWAIINGERHTGATMFYANDDIDAGEIIGRVKVEIRKKDDINIMEKRMARAYADLVKKYMPRIKSGNISTTKQNEPEATYCCRRAPQDGRINWNNSAVQIYNLIRALTYPFPGAFSFYGEKRVFIWKSEIVSKRDRYVGRISGRVIKINADQSVDVLTGCGIIRIKEVSFEGRKPVKPAHFIRSITDTFI